MVEIKEYLVKKPLVEEDQLHQMSKEHEPTITTRRSSTPPITQHAFIDRRTSLPATLFRNNSSSRISNKRI